MAFAWVTEILTTSLMPYHRGFYFLDHLMSLSVKIWEKRFNFFPFLSFREEKQKKLCNILKFSAMSDWIVQIYSIWKICKCVFNHINGQNRAWTINLAQKGTLFGQKKLKSEQFLKFVLVSLFLSDWIKPKKLSILIHRLSFSHLRELTWCGISSKRITGS